MHWWRGSSAKFRSPNFSGGVFPTIAHERVNSGRNETPPSGSRIGSGCPDGTSQHQPDGLGGCFTVALPLPAPSRWPFEMPAMVASGIRLD